MHELPKDAQKEDFDANSIDSLESNRSSDICKFYNVRQQSSH